MPPSVKFGKEAVADAAFELARAKGLEAVNARAVAVALGCSTQPIFRAFRNMDELKAEITRRAYEEYARRIKSEPSAEALSAEVPPYKLTGMGYIRFAQEEPRLFKMLFMCDRAGERAESDPTMDYVLELIMRQTGYSRELARGFHMQMWTFTHGLAVMAATKYINFTDEELSRLLSMQYDACRMYADGLAGTGGQGAVRG